MTFFRYLIIVLCLVGPFTGEVSAANHKQEFYRNFLEPIYHVQRLNYCTLDGKACGIPVATQYCKMMGYERADQAIIANNIGLTNYLLIRAQCKGWTCNGFKSITCVGRFSHDPTKNHYYRSQRFFYHRHDHYRVDWCYENGKGCGQRAAYSFCRRMGYMREQQYKQQKKVPATKALGNQKLCFGGACSGFSSITCYR